MERKEVERIVWDTFEDASKVKEKGCPTCNSYTPMVEITVYSDEVEGPPSEARVWRCLRCLNTFEEKLVKVDIGKDE